MKTRLFQIAGWVAEPAHYRLLVGLALLSLLALAVLQPGGRAIADGIATGGGH